MQSFLPLAFLLTTSVFAVAAGRPEPQVQIDTFFKDLSEKRGSAAMKELCEGTLLAAQRGIQLETYSPQLDTAIKLYGSVARIEKVEKKMYGESFVRLRSISYHNSGAPVFWEFMFVRPKDEWQIYIFRFNDQFYRAFSDTP